MFNILDIIKEKLKAFTENKKLIKTLSLVAVGLTAAIVCIASSGATIGYNVTYNGQVIATVKTKQAFNSIATDIKNQLSQKSEGEIGIPTFTPVVALKEDLATSKDIRKAIIDNTNSIAYASLLKINGEKVAFISDCDLKACLEEYKSSFNIKCDKSVSEFVDDIEIDTGYYFTDKVYTLEEAKDIISSIKVETKATITYESDIAYSTKTEYTDTKTTDYSKITQAGKVGTRVSTDDVVYLNGKEISRKVVSTKVLKEPVTQIKLVGTKKNYSSMGISASGFVFPIDTSKPWYVSSYWGDGRSHKAVDLSTRGDQTRKIYAAKAGKVIFAGGNKYSGYGYYVKIDHGDGLVTLYAHASKLLVKAGDRVAAGENIALVGTTGDSTGPHLHFEIQKNGVKINPAPYIGL